MTFFFNPYGIFKTIVFERMRFPALMRRVVVVFVFMLCLFQGRASYPLVRNFTRTHYNAGRQNWGITQDDLGRMYFGNSEGMLVTDSRRWDRYYLSNYSTVRCMLSAGDGAFYVGGSEEFGVFTPSRTNGEPVYNSFIPILGKDKPRQIGEIWHIHEVGSKIIFRGDHHLFRYDGKEIETINLPSKTSTSGVVGDKLYVALETNGLYWINDRNLEPVEDNGIFDGKRIVAILPFKHSVLVVTDFHGVFELSHDGVRPFVLPFSDFLKEHQVFCAGNSGDQYAFGTVDCGVVMYNPSTGAMSYSNIETGMQNNTVLSLYFDRDGNLWAGLDNGIDYILCNSPVANLIGASTNLGAGYASFISGNTLWLGTNQGLYSTPYPMADEPVPVSMRQMLKGQVWGLSEIGGTLFAACDAGLFYRSADGFKILGGIPGTWAVVPVPDSIVSASVGEDGKTPAGIYALASTYEHFYLLRYTPAGWESVGPVAGYDDIGGRCSIDSNGNVWIAHWMKGLYRLRLDVAQCRFVSSEFFDHTNGLPTDRDNFVNVLDGEAVISTEGGFYRYNPSTGKVEPYQNLTSIFGALPSARLYRPANNEIMSVNLTTIRTARRDASGIYQIDSLTFSPIASKLIPGHDNFNFLSPRRVIVSNQEGFYDVDLDRQSESHWEAPTFVNRIYASPDSLVYSASGALRAGEDSVLTLPYGLNSLRFEFVTPEYRTDEGVAYSYLLENYDTEWSPWSASDSKEYTRLREGDYTLRIRSADAYNQQTGECGFRFTILPPWYRSIWAKIFYLIVLLVVIWILVRTLRRISARAAIDMAKRKEKEMEAVRHAAREEALRKDYEIAALKSQQLEDDIKHKSEEISNITMNVVRKNEILLDIADRLTKIQDHQEVKAHRTPDVQRQLAKIQSVIRDNISHDDDWKDFTRNFDKAYDNYTLKLRQMHPDLSEGDLRMCCYLRMGLASKDIAPLLNISYRSVEMARYRLRKKMNLTRDVNLTDYLQRL